MSSFCVRTLNELEHGYLLMNNILGSWNKRPNEKWCKICQIKLLSSSKLFETLLHQNNWTWESDILTDYSPWPIGKS